MYFIHIFPYLSKGWTRDVVLGGIVRISSSLFAVVTLLIMALSLDAVQESSKRTLLSPTLTKDHLKVWFERVFFPMLVTKVFF
jgi:hypothetical protein